MSSTIHALRLVTSTQVGAFMRGIKSMIQGTRQLRQQWLTAGKDVGSSAARITTAVAAVAVISAVTFGKFEQTMTRVGAVTRTLGTRDFKVLQEAAREAGRTTKFSATQSAEAMENLGLAGLKTNEIIKALPGTLQLASAAQLSIAQAADIAAKTMRAYGFEAEDLTRINDTLVATFTTSNTDLSQLAEALKPVGPLARTLNVSLEQTSAVLAKLADKGYQGSLGGTALRNILAKLAGAAPEVTNKLRKMGIETLDASGNMRPLFDILQELEAAGLSGGKIMELFGARGGPQMAALLSTGTAELRRYTAELEANQGIARELEQSNLKTLAGRFAILKSSIEDVVIEVGKNLNPVLLEAITTLEKFIDEHRTDIIDKFSSAVTGLTGHLKNVIQWFNDASPAIGEVWDKLVQVTEAVREFIAEHPGILAAMLALKASSTLGVTQAIGSLTLALGSSVTALMSVVTWLTTTEAGMNLVAAATTRFKFALMALQSVAVVGIVIALAWALKEVAVWAQNSFGIFNPLIAIWEELRSAAHEIWTILSNELGPVFSEIGDVISNELMPVFKEIWTDIKNELLPAFSKMARSLALSLMPEFKQFAEFIKNQVIPKILEMIPTFRDVIKLFGDLAVGLASAVIPVIRELVKFGFWALHGAIIAVTSVIGVAVDSLTLMANLVDATLTPVLKALGVQMDKNQKKLEKEIKLIKERNDLEDDSVQLAKKRADSVVSSNSKEDLKARLNALSAERMALKRLIEEKRQAYEAGLISPAEYVKVRDLTKTLQALEQQITQTQSQINNAASNAGGGSPADLASALAEDGEAAQPVVQAEVDPKEIANIIRDSQRDARDKETPGFSKIRDFIDLGPTQEQFNQFIGTIEGMTPKIKGEISQLFDYFMQDGELTAAEMDYLAGRTASRLQQQSVWEDQRTQKQEVYKQSLQELGNKMVELKGKVPNNVLESLATSFNTLREQFRSGQIGIQQYQSGIAALTKETQKAADAAKAAADAAERKRLIEGKFSQKDFKTALEDRIIAFRQQQFSNAVESSFNALFGFNQQIGSVADGFGKLQSGMQGFGEQIGSIGSGVAQDVGQAMETLRSFYSSAQGQASNLRNQITQLEQNMTLVDTYSAKKRIQDMIDNLFNQINAITAAPPPTFAGVTGSDFFNDPGLQSVNTQNNRNEINLPNVTRISQIEVEDLYDKMDQVAQRRGSRFGGQR